MARDILFIDPRGRHTMVIFQWKALENFLHIFSPSNSGWYKHMSMGWTRPYNNFIRPTWDAGLKKEKRMFSPTLWWNSFFPLFNYLGVFLLRVNFSSSISIRFARGNLEYAFVSHIHFQLKQEKHVMGILKKVRNFFLLVKAYLHMKAPVNYFSGFFHLLLTKKLLRKRSEA